MSPSIVYWTLDEIRRQRKSSKDVSRTANLDKDTIYRWGEGRVVRLEALVAVLDVLGYELVALPSHYPKELVKE